VTTAKRLLNLTHTTFSEELKKHERGLAPTRESLYSVFIVHQLPQPPKTSKTGNGPCQFSFINHHHQQQQQLLLYISNMVNMELFVAGTWASLLSGLDILKCRSIVDPQCALGVVNVDAFVRHRSGHGMDPNKKSLVVARLVTNTPFVQMHPLDWNVNALIMNGILGWKFFVGTHSIFYQNSVDSFTVSRRDLSDLQSTDYPFLLSNANVAPEVSWHPFWESIYFDTETSLAMTAYVAIDDGVFSTPSIPTAQAQMDHIYRLNQENGCQGFAASNAESLIQQYLEVYVDNNGENESSTNSSNATTTCWIPFSNIASSFGDDMIEFINVMVEYKHPPAVIVGVGTVEGEEWAQPRKIGNTWVAIYPMNDRTYYEHKLEISDDGSNMIVDMGLYTQNLWELPLFYRDALWAQRLNKTIALANEALVSNRIVGYSQAVGDPRSNDDRNFRYCKGGECEVGNLFTDSLRWKTKSDVAFLTSGGFTGVGWPTGPVGIPNIWGVLSFGNTLCTAKMSGVSLFRLFNYTTSWSTFESAETEEGGRLLQVSGARVTYNTQLTGSRLVRLEVWDEESASYKDVERLRIYDVVSDSWVCGAYVDYPQLVGSSLTIQGEQPAVIGDTIIQDAVAEFLSQFSVSDPYDPSVSGRLVNDTSTTTTLNLIQTAESCAVGDFWIEEQQTCESCPDTSGVQWFRDVVEFSGVSGSSDVVAGNLTLVNGAAFALTLSPKTYPSWLTLVSLTSTINETVILDGDSDTTLQTGERMTLSFEMSSLNLNPGTAVGTVSFGVTDGGDYPGCDGRDASFEVSLTVSPLQEDNYLGSIRWLGWGMSIAIALASAISAILIMSYRKLHIIRTHQPSFLIGLAVGVGILGTSLIPISLDDEVVSQDGMDVACMATPWLVSLGFTVAFSTLFSKLWRINKLFSAQQFRRKQVLAKDVLLPFAILSCFNVGFLLAWTIADPLRWVRKEIDGQEWNTFGQCESDGPVGRTLLGLVVGLNFAALIGACWQAYNARNLSEEFSESKSIAIALYSWFQLLVVSLPVMYLVDEDSVEAKYCLVVGIISAVCWTMLVCIFLPIVYNAAKPRRNSVEQDNRVHVSGVITGASGASSNGFTSSSIQKLRAEFDTVDDEPESFKHEWSSTTGQTSHFSRVSGLDSHSKPTLESIDENEGDLSEAQLAMREQTSSEILKKKTSDESSSSDHSDEKIDPRQESFPEGDEKQGAQEESSPEDTLVENVGADDIA